MPPKAEPAVTPMMCGSTSGFWNTPCKVAPHSPSAPPASRAITTRGRRTDQTICPITPSPGGRWTRVWPTALRLNGYWPKQSEATAIASVASARLPCTSQG